MRKIILILCSICFLFGGCGDEKKIGKYTYTTYGLLNQEESRNPEIEYKIIFGNIVWSVILIETIIAPIYFIGFSMYEPIGVKDQNKIKGVLITQ